VDKNYYYVIIIYKIILDTEGGAGRGYTKVERDLQCSWGVG
jgi:hypothetical protein